MVFEKKDINNMKQSLHYRKILTLLLFAASTSLMAQNGALPAVGGRSTGMGGANVNFTDVSSALANQAGLAGVTTFSAMVAAEQRFVLAELRSFSAAAAYPTRSGTFALTLNYFGFEAYNEQRIGLAYGRKLFEGLYFGGQVLALTTRIPEYGSQTNLTFEAGLIAPLSSQFMIGVHTFSPVRVRLLEDENLPSILRMGIMYLPSEKLRISGSVEKDIVHPASIKAGLEYLPAEALAFRIGVSTEPVQLSFGAGFKLSNGLSLDIASAYHQTLGFTPSAGIIFQTPEKKK